MRDASFSGRSKGWCACRNLSLVCIFPPGGAGMDLFFPAHAVFGVAKCFILFGVFRPYGELRAFSDARCTSVLQISSARASNCWRTSAADASDEGVVDSVGGRGSLKPLIHGSARVRRARTLRWEWYFASAGISSPRR